MAIKSKAQQNLWHQKLAVKFSFFQIAIALSLIVTSLWIIITFQKEQFITQKLILHESHGHLISSKIQEVTDNVSNINLMVSNLAASTKMSDFDVNLRNIVNSVRKPNLTNAGNIHFNGDKNPYDISWFSNNNDQTNYNSLLSKSIALTPENLLNSSLAKFISKDNAFWSKVYNLDMLNRRTIAVSTGIWNEHQYAGSVTTNVDMKHLSVKFDEKTKIFPGYIIILDSHNQLLFYSKRLEDLNAKIAQKVHESDFFSSVFTRSSELNTITNTLSKIDLQIKKNADSYLSNSNTSQYNLKSTIKKSQIFNINTSWPKRTVLISSFNFDKDQFYRKPVFVSLFLIPTTYWKLIYVSPTTYSENIVFGVFNKISIYLILIQLIAFIIIFTSQHIFFTRPLTKIVRALIENKPEQFEIEANSRTNEFSMLAHAFINRNKQLETAIASLNSSNIALEQQKLFQDISQKELNTYRNQLHSLIKSSKNLIYIKDINGTYVLANDNYCQLIGMEKRHVIGSNDQILFPANLADTYSKHDKRAINAVDSVSFDEDFHTHHGIMTYHITKFAIRDSEDVIQGTGAIAFDISTRKLKEDKNLKFNRLLNKELETYKKELNEARESNKILQNNLIKNERESQQIQKENIWFVSRKNLLHDIIEDIITQLMLEQDDVIMKYCSHSEKNNSLITNLLSYQTEKLRRYYQLLQTRHKPTNSTNLSNLMGDLNLLSNDIFKNIIIKYPKFDDINAVVKGEKLELIHFFTTLFYYVVRIYQNIKSSTPLKVFIDFEIVSQNINIKVTSNIHFPLSVLMQNAYLLNDEILKNLNYWINNKCGGDLLLNITENGKAEIIIKLIFANTS